MIESGVLQPDNREKVVIPEIIFRESRQERYEKLLLRRNQLAVKALRLERYFGSLSRASDYDQAMVELLVRGAPNRFLETAGKALEAFYNTDRELNRIWPEIVVAAGGEERVGDFLFQCRTDQSPEKVGSISVLPMEGYVFLSFSSPNDYEGFVRGWGKDKVLEEETDGTFYSHGIPIDLPDDVHVPSAIAINSSNLSQAEVLQIFEHERQHFINNIVLERFAATEKNNDSPETLRLREIKDELLSFIRGGQDIRNLVNLEVYRKKFNYSFEEERLLLETHDLLFGFSHLLSPEVRALIVYNLIDVPLTNIPTRLEALLVFFNKIHHKFERFVPDDISVDFFVAHIKDGEFVFGEEEKRFLAQTCDEYLFFVAKRFQVAVGATEGPEFDMSEGKFFVWLLKKERAFREARDRLLFRDGVRRPYAYDFYAEKKSGAEASRKSTEIGRQVCQKVISTIDSLARNEIFDGLQEFFSPDRDLPKFVDKIESVGFWAKIEEVMREGGARNIRFHLSSLVDRVFSGLNFLVIYEVGEGDGENCYFNLNISPGSYPKKEDSIHEAK